MSDGKEQTIKSRARKLALEMVADSSSREKTSVDDELRNNPDLAVEFERQLRLLGVVNKVTAEETKRKAASFVSENESALDTTRIVDLLDTGGPLHDEVTLIPCPSCRQRLPQVVFAKDEISRRIKCLSCGYSVLLFDNRKGLQAGSMVAQFELISRLGAGSFGVVWKAHDTRLQRDVAIKVPRRGLLTSAQQNLFLREAKVAAAIRHPYVVAIYDTGVDRGTVYICSELIDGTTLAQWKHESCDSAWTAAAMVRKVALAIQAIHESSVIHRDLKPSNVMVDRNGDPQVMDFGLAKQDVFEATMTLSGEVLGTPAYMSPEAAKGESRSSDPRTDIYSIGVILYELLTGELPFRGDFTQLLQQIMHAKARSPIELNPNVPHELETICLKCLEKDPADRYQDARSLAEDLERFTQGRPILARRKSLAKRVLRASQAKPGLTLSLISLAVVIVLLLSATQYVLIASRAFNDSGSGGQMPPILINPELEQAQTRLELSALQKQSDSVLELAKVDSAESLQQATDAMRKWDLLELGENPIGFSAESGNFLATLQQGVGEALQHSAKVETQSWGIVLDCAGSRTGAKIGFLSVDESYDAQNPYALHVIDTNAENVIADSDSRIRRCRLRTVVDRFAMNDDASLLLAYTGDVADPDATSLWDPTRSARSLAIPLAVTQCCFPNWSEDVWILDDHGCVSCWSSERKPPDFATHKFDLPIDGPVKDFFPLAGEGEFMMRMVDEPCVVHVVFNLDNHEIKQRRVAEPHCRLIPLEPVSATRKTDSVVNRVCYWDEKNRELVIESWEAGSIDVERQYWSMNLPEVEDVEACFINQQGEWLCASTRTSAGQRWYFMNLARQTEQTEGITLSGDPGRGIRTYAGGRDIAVASSHSVFHYRIENGDAILRNQFSKGEAEVGAFCWLGARRSLAIAFGTEVQLRSPAPEHTAGATGKLSAEKVPVDGKILASSREKIVSIHSSSSSGTIIFMDQAGKFSYWKLRESDIDLFWKQKSWSTSKDSPRVQFTSDGKGVAMLDEAWGFSVYPEIPNPPNVGRWDAWEETGLTLSKQDVDQFCIAGSWLVTIDGKRDVSVYQVKSVNTRLFRKLPIKAEKAFISSDEQWLCLQQKSRVYFYNVENLRKTPWVINEVDPTSELSFVGSGHCMAAVGVGRVLRIWNPAIRKEEKINLSPLAPEKSRLINSQRETVFPNDDGNVFLLRQTDDGGYTKAGYIQMGIDGNPMTLLPSQKEQWWAIVSTPPPTGSVGSRRVSVALGKFARSEDKVDADRAGWGFVHPEQPDDDEPFKLENPRRDGLPGGAQAVMAISPDNQWLVRSNREGFDTWQVSTGAILPNPAQRGTSDPATRLEFSPDGKWLVSGHESGIVRCWRIMGDAFILSSPIEWNLHTTAIDSIVIDPTAAWCCCTTTGEVSCIPLDLSILMKVAKHKLR